MNAPFDIDRLASKLRLDKAGVARARKWLDGDAHACLFPEDPSYPALLRHIDSPPAVLFVAGRIDLLNVPSLAIVGSRNATGGGCETATNIARMLSDAGLTIVSGLALGIDAAAHRGGLDGKSSSIGVVGTGADVIYPRPNEKLARELMTRGCIVSEFPLGTPPLRDNFPRRNRIISGLCRGTLVVEAALESGSLITARLANDQGRDVFAIPGSIHSILSKGCHALIRDGAMLVEGGREILEEFRMQMPATTAPSGAGTRRRLPPADAALLEVMGFDPISMDEIVDRCGVEVATLAARLSNLEIEGRVCSLPGGRFQRLGARVIE